MGNNVVDLCIVFGRLVVAKLLTVTELRSLPTSPPCIRALICVGCKRWESKSGDVTSTLAGKSIFHIKPVINTIVLDTILVEE